MNKYKGVYAPPPPSAQQRLPAFTMTDPASLVGTVSGVLSLGISVSQGIATYCSQFKGYESQTVAFLHRLESLKNTLEHIERLLRDPRSSLKSCPIEAVQKVADCVLDCREWLQQLEKLLEKCQNSAFGRARYPFERETILDLEKTIAAFQSNLDTALQFLHL
jgi:hypothetical protein